MSNLLVSKPVSRRRKNQTHSKTRTVTIEYNITTEGGEIVAVCQSFLCRYFSKLYLFDAMTAFVTNSKTIEVKFF